MNKRIKKKLFKRAWCRTYREAYEKIDKPWLEYLESLKRPMTEEEIENNKFWKDLIGEWIS